MKKLLQLCLFLIAGAIMAANNPDISVALVAEGEPAMAVGGTQDLTATLGWPDGTPLSSGTFTWSATPTNLVTFNKTTSVDDSTSTVTITGINPGTASIKVSWQAPGYDSPETTIDVSVIKAEIGTLRYRVAPTKTISVTITLTPTPLPSGVSLDLECVADSGTTGSATVSPTTLSATGAVTITGGTQSWGSGNNAAPGNMKLNVKLDGTVIATSSGFTVCSHPINFSTSLISDLNGSSVGLKAQNDWNSDSGTRADMDKAQRSEVIGEGPRSNPPFTIGGSNVSGYIAATSPPTTDTHSYPKAGITAGPAGTCVFSQLFQYTCARCGDADKPCDNSGFTITHALTKQGNQWIHGCKKTGAAVTIGSLRSSAGMGTATSNNHNIP